MSVAVVRQTQAIKRRGGTRSAKNPNARIPTALDVDITLITPTA
jgi:hypothetical protein